MASFVRSQTTRAGLMLHRLNYDATPLRRHLGKKAIQRELRVSLVKTEAWNSWSRGTVNKECPRATWIQ